ncbi:hypothetical protein CHARACLAT_027977 [Characodon lateralis]|uniref:Uncharacterized protein n=1 Tax=Characodon lateralis TaxID=208331 RepID=A0ABU7EXN4_9TELE|nr:hypothetical protein [Characodon lateralis]
MYVKETHPDEPSPPTTPSAHYRVSQCAEERSWFDMQVLFMSANVISVQFREWGHVCVQTLLYFSTPSRPLPAAGALHRCLNFLGSRDWFIIVGAVGFPSPTFPTSLQFE